MRMKSEWNDNNGTTDGPSVRQFVKDLADCAVASYYLQYILRKKEMDTMNNLYSRGKRQVVGTKIIAAHRHWNCKRINQCVADLLDRNRISDEGEIDEEDES
ncbi:hypothetical protein EVAR_13205_1 [Eumeta japonica]|uniref:Uncharacterized protein n=1 Tax=Eumeta variegata TaxID=151549 RepID=A0A4C1TS43_EUMVA|nr:hypothetical protein EVAR_13205_1 [Eumeta japonica]